MTRRSAPLLKPVCALALVLLAWPALTQQTPARYNVEVVVFRALGESPGDESAMAAGDADAGTMSAQPSSARRLGDAANRLRGAAGFRVLGQASWTQVPAAWNSRRGVPLSDLGVAGGLSGSVILERGQYLHLGFDLRYTEGGKTWVMNEVRRVKVNERQYFDHAAIGAIAIVTPAG